VGNTPETKGTLLVVYEDIRDAFTAQQKLSGFSVGGRYLVVHFYKLPTASAFGLGGTPDLAKEAAEVELLRAQVAANEAAAAAAAGGAGGGGGGDDDEALDDESDRRRAAAAAAAARR
jgi:hypothetical protein